MVKGRAEARKILGASSIAFVAYLAQAAWAGDVYVDISGQYWPWAYRFIQQGIDAASDGDTVQVVGLGAAYPENIHFHGKDIVVTAIGLTVIHGGGNGPTVTFAGTEDETCVLQGFTIQGGMAEIWPGSGGGICGGDEDDHTHATIANNMILGNQAKNYGGGIAYCDGKIVGNTINGNSATYGGGLYGCNGPIRDNVIVGNSATRDWSRGGGLSECHGPIQDNTISGNSALQYGGGLYECNGPIQDNTIAGNSAKTAGGLGWCNGPILNNTITGNMADECGGGLYGCSDTIGNNMIAGNSADHGGGLYYCNGTIQNNTITNNSARALGGGLGSCHGAIQNNRITANSAVERGGGLHYCEETIQNNTISGNSASWGGGLDYCFGTIQNCIIWANTAPDGPELGSCSVPAYSCIQDWTGGGEGNIAYDPQFVDPDGPDNDPQAYEDNNYRLSEASPCIDAGKNEDWMWTAIDLDGNPRVADGDGDGVAVVDMGAYERRGAVTWRVDDSVAGSGDGKSWGTAFKTIQEGIDASIGGDVVVVAEGTYFENTQLKGKNIVLTSTAPLNPHVVANTIIDGNQAGSVVSFAGTEDEMCVLAGFTIRNGRADYGGGIFGGAYPDRSHATIQNNTIVGNRANVDGGGLINCDGTIENNMITGNFAAEYGGGLCKCSRTIRNNTITGNSAGCGGGGLDSCSGTIHNNTIEGNSAEDGGGLSYCRGTIQNCIIWGNIAQTDPELFESSMPTYSCIQNWSGSGEGNITNNPQFVDPDGPDNDPQTYENNDYRLREISPCVDTGKNQSWMWGALDLDGNNRIFFGGKSNTVDMGAYEYGSFRFTIVEVGRMSGNGLTLTWTSRPGDTYDVFVTYRLSGMGWALDSRVPSQGELTAWSSGSMPSSSVFFKVALH